MLVNYYVKDYKNRNISKTRLSVKIYNFSFNNLGIIRHNLSSVHKVMPIVFLNVIYL